jgi:hypothetical protein
MFRHVHMHKCTSICTKHLILIMPTLCLCILALLYASCINSIMHSKLQCIFISTLFIYFVVVVDGCSWILVESHCPVDCHSAQLCTIGPYSKPASQAPPSHYAFPTTISTSVAISQLFPLWREPCLNIFWLKISIFIVL